MYTSDMRNALNLVASTNLSLFANVFKNNITSSVIHIIVRLLKTE